MKAAIDIPPRADCYAVAEDKFMARWQALRHRQLSGLLSALVRLGVSANLLTTIGLLFGLIFVPVLFLSPAVALSLLLLHVLVDGLDGPLARFCGTASRKGSFADTLCDQIVVAASVVALVLHGDLSAVPGLVYVFVYTLVVVFSMVRNALGIPYRWLLRPRFLVYAAIPVDIYLLDGTLDIVVTLVLAPLLWTLFTGFRNIHRVL